MEKENKLVAQSQKNLFAKVNSSIGITNKLITENNKKLVVEIFEQNPKFFIDLISEYYFCSSNYIESMLHSFLHIAILYRDRA